MGAKFGQFVHMGSMPKSPLEFSSHSLSTFSLKFDVSETPEMRADLSALNPLTDRSTVCSEMYSMSLAIGCPEYCKWTRIYTRGEYLLAPYLNYNKLDKDKVQEVFGHSWLNIFNWICGFNPISCIAYTVTAWLASDLKMCGHWLLWHITSMLACVSE